ncbi:MAG: SMI1/KNR4 family protein [Isosphaerales bacterium]
MAGPLGELVKCWIAWGGIDERFSPDPAVLASSFRGDLESCRAGALPEVIAGWEERHGYRLPAGLRAWLSLSNGLFGSGPLIHPLSAIGPMVPFARVPEMIVQPESWFELGNPNVQTICIDLAYRYPGGGYPIFTSGDDAYSSSPCIIARSFEEWFLELLRQGGREYWFDPGFADFGDPWQSHRRHVDHPSLARRLGPFADRVARLHDSGADERTIALALGLSPGDVESIFRHLQHISADRAPSRAVGS